MATADQTDPFRPTVLIVDDRPANLYSLRTLLGTLDAEVIEARSGNEALSQALEQRIALILLDVEMPGMDGFEVARLIKGYASTRLTPIIFLTAAHSDEPRRLRGYEAGAVDYIEKPLNEKILLGKARVFLELDIHRHNESRMRTTLEETNRRLQAQMAERQHAEQELAKLNHTLEERVIQRTLELERANQHLARFAFAASHDLQEPLRAISSFLQLLDKRYRDRLDASARRYIEHAVEGAARMRVLVQGLLTYTQIDSVHAAFEAVNATVSLEKALNNLSRLIDRSGAAISYGDLPTVVADGAQLTQLFQNLVENAITFCDRRPPRVSIGAEPGLNAWTFSVTDNGVGLEERFREHIFSLFRKIHHPGRFRGAGIGLAVSQRIVERHGGRIGVEPNPDGEGGSRFFFTLPLPP